MECIDEKKLLKLSLKMRYNHIENEIIARFKNLEQLTISFELYDEEDK